MSYFPLPNIKTHLHQPLPSSSLRLQSGNFAPPAQCPSVHLWLEFYLLFICSGPDSTMTLVSLLYTSHSFLGQDYIKVQPPLLAFFSVWYSPRLPSSYSETDFLGEVPTVKDLIFLLVPHSQSISVQFHPYCNKLPVTIRSLTFISPEMKYTFQPEFQFHATCDISTLSTLEIVSLMTLQSSGLPLTSLTTSSDSGNDS
jgi:hypothetical protein